MTELGLVRPARAGGFERTLHLEGWSARSRWGFDSVLECYWAELWPLTSIGPRPAVPLRVGTEHLITTVAGLSRVLGEMLGTAPDAPYLALTA